MVLNANQIAAKMKLKDGASNSIGKNDQPEPFESLPFMANRLVVLWGKIGDRGGIRNAHEQQSSFHHGARLFGS